MKIGIGALMLLASACSSVPPPVTIPPKLVEVQLGRNPPRITVGFERGAIKVNVVGYAVCDKQEEPSTARIEQLVERADWFTSHRDEPGGERREQLARLDLRQAKRHRPTGKTYDCDPEYYSGAPVWVEIGGQRVEAKLDARGTAILRPSGMEAVLRRLATPVVEVLFAPPDEVFKGKKFRRRFDLRDSSGFSTLAVQHVTAILEKAIAERDPSVADDCVKWAATYPQVDCQRYQQTVATWRAEDEEKAAQEAEADRVAAQEEATRQNEVRDAVKAQLERWELIVPYRKLLERSGNREIDWLSKNRDAALLSGAESLAVAVRMLRGANSELAQIREMASSLDPADIRNGYLWKRYNLSAQLWNALVLLFSARVEAAQSPQFCPKDLEGFVESGASQCERGLTTEWEGRRCVVGCMPYNCVGDPAYFNVWCSNKLDQCTQGCAERMLINRSWNESPARRQCEERAFALRCKKQREIRRWVGNANVDGLQVELLDMSLFFAQLLNGLRRLNALIGGTRANLYEYARESLGRSDDQILQAILRIYPDTPPSEWDAETILEALGSRHGLF